MMLAARSATPEVAACMFKAFTPHAIDAMGLDNERQPYDMLEVIRCIVDYGEFEQVQDFLDGKIAAASKAVVKIGADAVY